MERTVWTLSIRVVEKRKNGAPLSIAQIDRKPEDEEWDYWEGRLHGAENQGLAVSCGQVGQKVVDQRLSCVMRKLC